VKHLLLLLAVVLLAACSFSRHEVDLIVHNGNIITGDSEMPKAEAFAVKDGRIVELGAERRILNRYKSANKVDIQKATVYPGFIDAHCHFLGYGLNKAQANLKDCKSLDEVVSRLQDHQSKYPSSWIIGRGWDQNAWSMGDFPDRALLDEAFPDVPVFITRVDGHAALVNSKALEITGVTGFEAVEGGECIIRDERFTGVLIDNAIDLVKIHLPKPTKEEQTRALLEAERDCAVAGITSVADAGLDRAEIELIDELHRSGQLRMPIYAMVTPTPANLDYYLESGPIKTDRLHVKSFKFYADGALGSRGACLLEPYSDMPGRIHLGFLLSEIDYLETCAERIHQAGFQMNTHCIGDSANRAILELYGRVLREPNDYRWRIEHAQVVHKSDLPLFAAYSVLPSVQPTHATSDMYWAGLRLGRNRIHRAYAYRELLEQLGILALGTDFPVEGLSPMNTFYAAVVRKDAKGFPEGGFNFDNALTREQAFAGMTLWAALAQFEEHEKGTLSVGKWANFVVLDRDLLTCPEDEILKTRVRATYIQGEALFEE
jgi:predicted amidohydrolase YtcJ